MQNLTLLRHAKSGYVDGLTDFKRYLTERGRRDAVTLANTLRNRDCVPTALLVSSAVRTRETTQIVLEALSLYTIPIAYLSDLYLASPDVLLREIDRVDDTAHLMLIGHNPGLELLSTMLDPSSPERMGTCSLNHFELVNGAADASNTLGKSLDTQQSNYPPEAQTSDIEIPTNLGKTTNRRLLRGSWEAHLKFHERPSG